MTDLAKLAAEVLQKSKPQRPECPVCKGRMQVETRDENSETLVCASVKGHNMAGDTRRYDPKHVSDSRTKHSNKMDDATLKKNMVAAFESLTGKSPKTEEPKEEPKGEGEPKADKSGKKGKGKDKDKGKEGEKKLLLGEKER